MKTELKLHCRTLPQKMHVRVMHHRVTNVSIISNTSHSQNISNQKIRGEGTPWWLRGKDGDNEPQYPQFRSSQEPLLHVDPFLTLPYFLSLQSL